MTAARARVRPRDIVIVALLVSGLLAGLLLVIFGGGDDATTTTAAPSAATLPLDRVAVDELASWSGLVVPDDAADFLTAAMGSSQLDVTFTMPVDAEADFLAESELPELEDDLRVVLHSSPLWKLNPGDPDEERSTDGDAAEGDETTTSATEQTTTTVAAPEIRGTADVRDGVSRVVEVYEESPGVLRVRVVLTPAS